MSPLQGDEQEGKEGKGLKILTSKKLLNILPIIFSQIKVGLLSEHTIKKESRQLLFKYKHRYSMNDIHEHRKRQNK